MERNIKVSQNKKYSPLRHSIKLKSKIETNEIPIEKVEFIFEESNQITTPKKNMIKHIYKEKENIMNLISKQLKEIPNQKKLIKNQKSNTIYPMQKRIFNIRKKYSNINNKPIKENNNASFKRIYPLTYKNIQNLNKEKLMHKSQSNPTFNASQEMNMESNFMKLSKEANIYTSNANYIQNKKILLFDKYNYDNNLYVPDRAKLFDMTRMPKMPKKNSFVYKTTKFRAGHLINGNNNTYDFGKNIGFSNASLLGLNLKNGLNKNLLYRNYENNYISPYSYLDNTFQKKKRHPPSDTFYKELMSKKNETYEQYFKNVDYDKEKDKDKEIITDEYLESSDINNKKDRNETVILSSNFKK